MNPTPSNDPRSCGPLVDNLLAGCPAAVIDAIAAAAEIRTYSAGTTIFVEEEPVTGVFCHCQGEIAIELGRGEARHEVGRSRPGMLLGFREPERHRSYIVTCVALSDAVVYFIPIDVFMTQLRSSPHLMLNVMKSLSERIDGLEERLHA